MKILRIAEPLETTSPFYPGVREAMDGSTAVVAMEIAGSEAAGAYPITPSTQMGEGWAAAVAQGHTNVFGRRLLFFEPEGEHAAAAVTAGMSMVGLRSTNFSSGQGIAYMHESLYAAAGKRLTYVLNIAARAMTKHALNVHAGHDDYHAIDDTGFFQLFAKDVQETADLNLIAHRIAELSLNPGVMAQDGFLTSHVIESLLLPEAELIRDYLGDPGELIDSPTPAQRLTFGPRRRRIPELFDLDYPAMLGVVQNQDSYAQGVAAQRPFYFDHVRELTDRSFDEFAQLTGRQYARASGYRLEDAEYVLAGQGSVVPNAEAVADHLRETRGLRVGVLNLTMFRPFPSDLVTRLLAGKRAVTVLERVDQPLAVDPPLLRELRAAISQALENGRAARERALDGRDKEAGGPEATGGGGRGAAGSGGNGDLDPGRIGGRGSGGLLERFGLRPGSRSLAPEPTLPYPELPVLLPADVPDFHSGCFGLGSRDFQPGDLIAAVENMLPAGGRRRQFYLGIDFVRRDTRHPKLQLWQEQLLDGYPHLAELALAPVGEPNLLPAGSLALRIHSVGGWGAMTMGKNIALTAFELFGLHIKANPKYGSEKKGQPTTFYATLASEPIRLNCELRHVDVVLAPDPNVFRHSDPLAGLAEDGVFVIQSDLGPAALWDSLPAAARHTIKRRRIRVYALDAFRIASEEATDLDLRYRMQGTAFLGAFFAVSPLLEREGLDEAALFDGMRVQLEKKFGHRGERVVADNLRVIRRGYDELVEVEPVADGEAASESTGAVPTIPALMDIPGAAPGLGDPGRFWEQVCSLCKLGQDGIADPFAAISAMPAASSAIRDMTDVRFEIPEFVADKCTGCAQCWVQCPDSAIPALVNSAEDVIDAAIATAAESRPVDRMRQISKPLARETRRILKGATFTTFADTLSAAFGDLAPKLGWEPDRRSALEQEFASVFAAVVDFPLARTGPFYDAPERREKNAGGLLSIVINPETCKGCNLCVEVCPDDALITIKQDESAVERLRRNWRLWRHLPDTDDRYINIAKLDEGIGVLSSLLLKKGNYLSMVGGDGACMGCGEKTAVHLVVSTIHALMQPRVDERVRKLEDLITRLELLARELLVAEADLDAAAGAAGERVEIPIRGERKLRLERVQRLAAALKDLHWRYTDGPSGRGRAHLGMTNATGCSSVWGSTYPYNPYPFPWANHLFQDATSLAIGIFEGHMRKMSDGFAAVRRAELELAGEYDPDTHEKELANLDWFAFTDEEFGLCPPIVAMGGDGAMLDIGFQNLSRLLASGKPIRVVVLDTQVYSNTGGQACTSGYTGQVSDMAAWGKAQHGKQEERKELGLLALAHRGAFVHQSSQAAASHLIAGVIRALQTRRPAVVNLYTPCPVEHGLADDWAQRAARLALESRAFPFLTYDPDGGPDLADRLSLDGNPSAEEDWPNYTLDYVDDDGAPQKLELPLTTADWAATEGRFKQHFRPVPRDRWDENMVPFHEYVALDPEARAGSSPFIHALDDDRRLSRLSVSEEMIRLTEERQRFWRQLREMAGEEVAASVRDRIADTLETEFEQRVAALRSEYDGKLAELKSFYPRAVARRMAEGLLRSVEGKETLAELLGEALATPPIEGGPAPADLDTLFGGARPDGGTAETRGEPGPAGARAATAPSAGTAGPGAVADGAVVTAEEEEEGIALEPYIDTALCTSCNECTDINNKLFAYDDNKQAYIKDARAGTFAQIVMGAERCPVRIIHPGTPLNPKEKDLDKWIERAKPFN